jgi:hypothetical protein
VTLHLHRTHPPTPARPRTRRHRSDGRRSPHPDTPHRHPATRAAKLREPIRTYSDAMIAVASSFPSRAHAAPFGSGTLPPPSTRRSTSLRHPRVSALGGGLEGEPGKILDPRATPFQILGLDAAAGYSAAELKAAFRARVV